jgi:hypothetical protein
VTVLIGDDPGAVGAQIREHAVAEGRIVDDQGVDAVAAVRPGAPAERRAENVVAGAAVQGVALAGRQVVVSAEAVDGVGDRGWRRAGQDVVVFSSVDDGHGPSPLFSRTAVHRRPRRRADVWEGIST